MPSARPRPAAPVGHGRRSGWALSSSQSNGLWSRVVRRLAHGFEQMCDPDHIAAAADRTVRGKRRRPDVAAFLLYRESVLAELTDQLQRGAWRPDGFRIRFLRDPKPRAIACATVADRIVHTALVDVVGPVFIRSLRPEHFACRPGMGTHRAVLRLARQMRRHRFVLHLDVAAYFASVDLDVLRGLVWRRVLDGRLRDIVDAILEDGRFIYDVPEVRAHARLGDDGPGPRCGLPIGALTSQLFAAHVYLDALDHFATRILKIPGYTRYVDDVIIFGDRRADLRRWRAELAEWLCEERRLRLKHPKAPALSCAGHLDALGRRIRRDRVEPHPRALRRLRARVAREMDGMPGGLPSPTFDESLASAIRHAMSP